MKIGIFSESYKPYTSGVVTSIATFKDELTQRGHEIYIFAPDYPNYEEVEENVHRFVSIPSPTNPGYTLALPLAPGMRALIKNLQLDIIHAHSPWTTGRVGLHYARKYNLPLLFTYHTRYDQYAHYVPGPHELAKEMILKFSRLFCNECDHIIAPSREIESIIKSQKVTTPISVIPTGVPLEKYQNGDRGYLRKKYSIPDNNRILLFAGRLSQEKNLFFLLEAYKKVKRQIPNTTLVLVAGGPLEEELKEYAIKLKLSLRKDVIFTGRLPFDDLVNAYFSADLFVFSSVTETQGLVLIEAMAAGLPVAAVKAPGVREMVDDDIDGLLTSENTEEFAAAICRILQDDQMYQRFQTNALLKAEQLSSHNMALKMEQTYEEVLNWKRNQYKNLGNVSSGMKL